MRTAIVVLAAVLLAMIVRAVAARGGPRQPQQAPPNGSAVSQPGQDAADPVAGSPTETGRPPQAGILCPDGSYLRPLNGVQAPPPIQRAAEHGPLPPVIATRKDSAGNDWYEHADGSVTTTRLQTVFDGAGNPMLQAMTLHNAGLPADGSIRFLPLSRSPHTSDR